MPDDSLVESTLDSDVIYAKPMKSSFKVSVEEESTGKKTPETGKKTFTVGAIALPEPSSMGGSAGSQYQEIDQSTMESPSHYEEVDLSAVANARMSTSEDIQLTDL